MFCALQQNKCYCVNPLNVIIIEIIVLGLTGPDSRLGSLYYLINNVLTCH